MSRMAWGSEAKPQIPFATKPLLSSVLAAIPDAMHRQCGASIGLTGLGGAGAGGNRNGNKGDHKSFHRMSPGWGIEGNRRVRLLPCVPICRRHMGWPSLWGLSGEAITRGNSNEPFARAEECSSCRRDTLVSVLLRKREDLGATAGPPALRTWMPCCFSQGPLGVRSVCRALSRPRRCLLV